MSLAQASRTAIMPGMLRAQHQTVDAEPKILVDPIAATLLNDPAVPQQRAWIDAMPAEMVACFRSTFVIRSGITEQLLAEAVARGVGQYLILAAGMDTFGFRQPTWASGMEIREMDHPLTQAYKLDRVRDSGHPVPVNLKFVAVDFTTETMAEGLQRTGLDPNRPVFASWLGCAMYLTREQIVQSMRPLAAWPGGAELSASFIAADWSDLEPTQRMLLKIGMEGAASIGEPWLTLADEAETAELLKSAGFKVARRISRAEIEKRCSFPRQDLLRPPFEMIFYANSRAPE